jgi:D-cysteine desulfhydrase
MRLDEIPRIHIADLPTPLDSASNLADELGIDCLLIKRDDNTGLALGGNKARKLEYLMAEALAAKADVVLACGGPQSNHVRMTAAAARKLGMDCIIFMPRESIPESFEGNLLLDAILGAEMRFLPELGFAGLNRAMAHEEARLLEEGRKPYVIPIGGSTPLGAVGYVTAVRELADQLKQHGYENADIVVALGTGGTLAGIILGTYLFMPNSKVIGISVVMPKHAIRPKVERLAVSAAKLINVGHEPDFSRMDIFDEYLGPGYGIPTPECKEAILQTARTEGIVLDPVYTGKAMAGLIDLARNGHIGRDKPVVFWHTGGAPALFAYEKTFHDEAVKLAKQVSREASEDKQQSEYSEEEP